MSNSKRNSSLSPLTNESSQAVPNCDTVNGLRAGIYRMKDNTFYFQHDNTALQDEKIIDLRAELGFEGYGIFWALLELLHQNNGYLQMNSKRLAFALQVPEQILSKVINDFDLFIIDNDNFYSERLLDQINYRASIIDKRRNAGSKGGKSTAIAKQMLSKTAPKERKVKERKEEESKENKEKEKLKFKEDVFSFSAVYSESMLDEFYRYWVECDQKGKMKWQKEKTWELNLRLEYWKKRGEKFAQKPIKETAAWQ